MAALADSSSDLCRILDQVVVVRDEYVGDTASNQTDLAQKGSGDTAASTVNTPSLDRPEKPDPLSAFPEITVNSVFLKKIGTGLFNSVAGTGFGVIGAIVGQFFDKISKAKKVEPDESHRSDRNEKN